MSFKIYRILTIIVIISNSHFLLSQEDESFDEVAQSRTEMFPKIFIKGDLDKSAKAAIIAENLVLCEVDGGLVAATIGFMAANYVFMFKYSGPLNNFCLFLQKCVLQI